MSENHHVVPLKTLLYNAGALLVLTILTVAVTWLHIPEPFNVVVAIGIACIKASLVAMIFMNLYWDNKFNTIVFLSSLVFFLVFVFITLLDTLFRDVPFGIY
ncbi:MAG: cytochrome C oxidase subunit IV family protein [Balneolales bacterium]